MIKRLLYLLALPLILTTACQSGPSEAEQKEKLESDVMALHDEAMAEMGTIYRLRRELTSLRDSLQNQATDTAATQQLTCEITQLEVADEAMMNWMRRYKAPTEEQPPKEAISYLQQQQTKMEQVKHLMDSTITVARNTLKDHDQH
jgi:Mg2+ and Co2+ transporter CorA